MPDFIGAAMGAVAHGDPLAWALVIVAGFLSSSGPCAATRAMALAAFVVRSPHPVRVASVFTLGTLSVYAGLGFTAGAFMQTVLGVERWVYLAIATAGIVGGVVTLVGARWHRCDVERAPEAQSLGAVFLVGAAFAMLVSPCCTPILAAILVYGGAHGPVQATGLMVGFGLGHLLPLVIATLVSRPWLNRLTDSPFSQAAELVAGASMLAFGGFYALLV